VPVGAEGGGGGGEEEEEGGARKKSTVLCTAEGKSLNHFLSEKLLSA